MTTALTNTEANFYTKDGTRFHVSDFQHKGSPAVFFHVQTDSGSLYKTLSLRDAEQLIDGLRLVIDAAFVASR